MQGRVIKESAIGLSLPARSAIQYVKESAIGLSLPARSAIQSFRESACSRRFVYWIPDQVGHDEPYFRHQPVIAGSIGNPVF
ncbi:MAG: hypothetical protein ACNA7J_14625 [Wenzhouxiangella sp.]